MKALFLSLAAMTVLMLGACSTAQVEYAVYETSSTATVFTLEQIDATESEASTVRDIAIAVEDVLDGDGEVDLKKVKALVLKELGRHFEGEDKDKLVLIVNKVSTAVVEALKQNKDDFDFESKVVIYVRAATRGVKDGAQLYLEVKGFEPADTQPSTQPAE